MTSPLVIIFHSQLVLLGSLGIQWEYTLPRRHSTLNNIMFTGDDMSERCCQSQLVILSSPGAQWEQTLLWGHSTLNNMTIFIANWWQWQLTSLGALYMEQYCVHCMSGPSGNTEFPWGTMSADSFPGSLNSEQCDDISWPTGDIELP